MLWQTHADGTNASQACLWPLPRDISSNSVIVVMTAGGPGDHPLSDVVHYDIEVYGEEADGLLKKLAPLMSERELREWWEKEIGWSCNPEQARDKIREQLSVAETRARESGWETE